MSDEKRLAMRECIHRNDIEGVKELLATNPNLLSQSLTPNWGAPLAYAANLGRLELMQFFENKGARDFQHAFERSCLQGQLESARWLFSKGAVIEDGIIMGCCETLNSEGLEFLLELGASVVDKKGDKSAPLGLLLQTYSRDPKGKHRCFEILGRHGVELPDTPALAFHRGRIDLLEKHLAHDSNLLQRRFSYEEIYPPELGCHVSSKQWGLHGSPLAGCGLLHMSVDFDEREVFHWLLEKGTDPNLKASVDEDGFGLQTPLFNAVVSQSYLCGRQKEGSMASDLLSRGADPLVRASLKKAVLFTDDDTVHEYLNVTAYEFGMQFSHQEWVNPAVMNLIRYASDKMT